MAKTLIVTFLLCVAVATVAETSTNSPPTTTPKSTTTTTPIPPPPTTTKTTTTTTKAPTPAPTTKTTTTTTKAPTPAPTTKTTTTTTKAPTPAPTTKTTTTTTKAPTPTPTTKTTTTTTKAPTPTPASTTTPPTGTPPTEGSSVSPNTGSSQTNAPSTAPVTEPPKPSGACPSNPCPTGSTCDERFDQTFTCLCRPGEVYDGAFCRRAQVFPGLLVWKEEFKPEMADKTSQMFLETSHRISLEVDKEFQENTGFLTAVVLELREKKSTARETPSDIEASVQIVYDSTADVTTETVEKTLEAIPLVESFTAGNLCDLTTCDTSTSTCEATDGNFRCSCKDGFKETDYSERLCVAECPVGEMLVDNECKECGFGYTGFNCKNNTLLIVVIVCCILGALVIAALIALPLVAKKSKKKSSKRNEEDIGKPYQSHSVAKAPLSYGNGNSNDFSASVKEPTNSLANSGAPRIPRATANSNWESRTNLEMTPSNSRQNLIPSGMNSRFNDNQDDMYSFSQNRPKNHAYEEMQPKSNPYSQNRASNPYAQTRGQTNPYYN